MDRFLLGAHMSIAGGFDKAIERGALLHCTAVQIFTKNNRQWHAPEITRAEEILFKSACKNFNMSMVIAHATYLINLAASSEYVLQQSCRALVQELERCEQLNIPYLVLHPGSYTNMSQEQALLRVIQSLDYVFSQARSESCMILLENMAGQGTQLCSSIEQLAHIIQHSKYAHRLGVCFDTCHAYAAGYDFGEPKIYQQFWQMFDSIVGIDRLRAIHLNDSKKMRGAGVDRHEHIGEGMIGLHAFQYLCNDSRFLYIPKILETPKKDSEDDRRNMQTIVELLSESTVRLWHKKIEQ